MAQSQSAPVDTAEVILERLHDDVTPPSRATAGSAGMDLCAYLRSQLVKFSNGVGQSERWTVEEGDSWGVTLAPGEIALIPLGFRTRMPADIEAQIRPRSGQAFKNALTIPNAPGTIDSDYAEEWKVILRNESPVPKRIVHGERIAQVVFARVQPVSIVESPVERTTDRIGGFGSTGA